MVGGVRILPTVPGDLFQGFLGAFEPSLLMISQDEWLLNLTAPPIWRHTLGSVKGASSPRKGPCPPLILADFANLLSA
jgi:hypothetical protein